MQLASTATGICMAQFIDSRNTPNNCIQKIAKELQLPITNSTNVHIDLCIVELQKYFANANNTFTIPLHYIGTDFQQKVWLQLKSISCGKTITYKQQAIAMKNPLAIRAIATANGQNKIAIIIPCHRVIGSTGSLVGYAAGVHRKKWLLQHEGALGLEIFEP
jgi:AraC family transcriptional regulator, regulatory protein of adaptative response / methylated-DNA-[protein]-cysteine methyltransferase